MSVDFSQLIQPDIIEEIDFETLYAERQEALINLWSSEEQPTIRQTLTRESEPLVKLLQENCYREMILRNRINQAARALLLAYATKNDLDQLGANFNVKRLIVSPADNSTTPPTEAIMESDDAFRERIQLAFDTLSVAGPEAAYKKFARDADGRVGDVSVISPQPAYITLTILQADSLTGAASPELIQIVSNAVTAEDVRPIGDRVTVQSAFIVNYAINAKLYIGKDPEAATLLQQAITNVTAYATKQKRLGRSIRMSAIYAALHIDGVNRVELISPTADVVLTSAQASYCTNISVTIGGIE
ncbi:baseplate J/gp47 family protein [Acinetobacter sp. ANC 4173]|uniref:baseplate J/gp47 family protein n=1 Tax=Acinetobacter sp. ANC 4173 TaxID=2529837 RepID=UPI00103ED9DF|nr:baseplate J/gp47 family protein [Acinetobacter sp. ANC 4173]TCB81650.1 baseplate assembly protein [Acinetobacter sp. ANC 4173]